MVRHILMTTDTKGGVWSYSIELSRAIAGHGIRISLVTSGDPLTKDQRREAARVPRLAVCEGRPELSRNRHAEQNMGAKSAWLSDLVSHLNPDLIHMNGVDYGPISFPVPVVVVAHAIYSNRSFETTVQQADYLVSPTQSALETIKALTEVKTPSSVIPYFQRMFDRQVPQKQKLIFSGGRFEDSTSALSPIVELADHLDWPVVTAADSSHALAGNSSNTIKRVSQKSNAAQATENLLRASIYYQPSASDHLELSVLEGALSHCALVVEDMPSLRENWTNCAVFVPPNNVDALRTNLKLLIDDDDFRKELADRAYDRAKEFSPERCIDDYLDVYQAAVSHFARSKSKLV
jgi:hypothetical protein